MKVLINQCYGGFGYSDEFTDHINALTNDKFVNSSALWDRANPFIIEEAIKFGLKKAAGSCANLVIVEIPSGALYKVGEYDGQEWIEQTWIEVTIEELRKGLTTEQLEMVLSGCDVKLKSQ